MSDADDEAFERERRIRFETAERLKRIKQKVQQVEMQKEIERQENLKQKRIQHQTYVQQPPKSSHSQNKQKDAQPISIQDQMKNDFEKYLKNIQQYASMDLSYLKPLNQGESADKKIFMKAVHDQYKGRPTSSKASEINEKGAQGTRVFSRAGSKLGQSQSNLQKPSQPTSSVQSNIKEVDFSEQLVQEDSDDLNEYDLNASQVKLLPETAVSTSDEEDLNQSLQRTKQEMQNQQRLLQPSKKYQQDFSQVMDKEGVRVISKNSQRPQLDTSKAPKPLKPMTNQQKLAQQQNNQIKNKLSLLKQQSLANNNQLQNKQSGSRSASNFGAKKQLKVKPETLQEYKKLQQQLESIEKEENQVAAELVRLNDKIEYITTQSQYVESLIQNISIIKVNKSPRPPVSNGVESQISMASVFQSKAVSSMSPTQANNINKANTLVEDNEDLQALIERLNDLPDIQDANEYTDEEKALVRDEKIRLTTLIKQFQSRLIMNRVRGTTKVNKMQVIDPIAKMKLPPSMQKQDNQNSQPPKAANLPARQASQPFKQQVQNRIYENKQANVVASNEINNELFALSSAEPFNNTVKHVMPPHNDVENRSLLNALFGDNNQNQKPVQNMKNMYQRNTIKSRPQSVNNNPQVKIQQQNIDVSVVDEQNDEPLYINNAKYLDSGTQEDPNDGIYQIENNVKSYEQQKYEQFLKQYEQNENDVGDDEEDYKDGYQEQYGLYDMMQQGQVGQESDEDYDFTGV